MLIKVLDRVLYKDTFIGRRYVKATSDKREQLLKFRERFNKKQRELRTRAAAELANEATFTIERDMGFKIIPKPTYPEVQAIVAKGTKIIENTDVDTSRGNFKDQLLTRLLPKEEVSLDSPFFQLVLRKDVIAAISNYLGMVPILNKVDIWYSKPSAELSNSQLHHCDFESHIQLKLFVAISDVEQASGPLTVVDAKNSEIIRQSIKYRFGQKIEDAVIEKYVPAEAQHRGIGKKGTMIFADTSQCFHYGSRVETDDKHRVVAMYQFLRPQSFGLSLDYRKNSPFHHLATPDMPQYQRLFLGAE